MPKPVTTQGISRYLKSKTGQELLRCHGYDAEHHENGVTIFDRKKPKIDQQRGSPMVVRYRQIDLMMPGQIRSQDNQYFDFTKELARRLKLRHPPLPTKFT